MCIAAHRGTMAAMKKYCFNEHFYVNRNKLDLCIVFNEVDEDTLSFVKTLDPEYVFVKENFGMDPAAFDFAINHTKSYENYLLLHYDHWFIDGGWFDRLTAEIDRVGADVLGNLVLPATSNLSPHYNLVSSAYGLENLIPSKYHAFLQGGAGLYKQRAIETFKRKGGIPYGRNLNREVAFICERLQSFLLLESGCTFAQIEPGYEQYLKHAEF
jgi:hypothetical protein